MRKKIQQLAEGRFDYSNDIPDFTLSVPKIELEVPEGRDTTGFFEIISKDESKVRGVIYSDNPRMECLTPQFDGVGQKIRYQFHSEGLSEGDIQKGEFCIVCDQGEYNLSFVVSVTKLYADSSIGKIRNMDDFLKLARMGSEEAYRLFYSKNFKKLIKDEKERLLYNGIAKYTPSRQKLEEFLVSSGRKKRVELSLTEEKREFPAVTECVCETVDLQKKNWGAIDIEVHTDGDFLSLEKTHLTETDFLGSTYAVTYYLNPDNMHAGRNYGRLIFSSAGWNAVYVITARRNEAPAVRSEERKQEVFREVQQARMHLMELYIQFRLKKIVTGAWARQTVEAAEHLSLLEPENEFWNLVKAQALLVNRQRQEASWILDEFKRRYKEDQTPIWAYYLYLCTLMEREKTYVDRLTEQIEQIFLHYPKNGLLFWILLLIREKYLGHSSLKLKAISRWEGHGKNSPFFFIEAYYAVWQEPYLLAEWSPFSVRLLRWAAKWDVLSREMVQQIKQLLPQQREFHQAMEPVLKKCFEVDHSDEMLEVICGYLIRGQRFDKKYHKWYKAGVEREIRITGLYEAYLFSADQETAVPIPKTMQMYFQYKSDLSVENLAFLYSNIIASHGKQPGIYQKYRRNIEQFGIQQMENGRIDENMAVIYNHILSSVMINREMAEYAAKILFARKLVCRRERIVSACIIEKERTISQQIRITNGVGYFQAYTGEYQMILIDNDGNCYAGTDDYYDVPLLETEKYAAVGIELDAAALPYLLYYFSDEKNFKSEGWNKDNLGLLLASDEVTDRYKNSLILKQLFCCKRKENPEEIVKYLDYLRFEQLSPKDKADIIRLLIENQLYEKACLLIKTEGYDMLDGKQKVLLCSYCIETYDAQEDDELLGLAESCFLDGKYNDQILSYLCTFYNGPTKKMAALWTIAKHFGAPVEELSERILIQMLYSSEYIENIDEIFDCYKNAYGETIVCMAYLSFFTHAYVAYGSIVPENVFSELIRLYSEEKPLSFTCKTGLLKYLAKKETLEVSEEQAADELLEEFTAKQIYFAFYEGFKGRLAEKYQLAGYRFIEYYGRPGEKIWISYSENAKTTRRELMSEMYSGIYVKRFLLFYGDILSYSIQKKEDQEWVTLSEKELRINTQSALKQSGRFGMLDEMCAAGIDGDMDVLKDKMMQYEYLKALTESLFGILK